MLREERYAQARALGYELVSYVSSRCTYLTHIRTATTVSSSRTTPSSRSCGSADNVTLWSGNHIGHDSTIGDHCFISSHVVVSGTSTIGHHCFIGVNATLRNNVTWPSTR